MRKLIFIVVLCAFITSPALADFYGGQANWTRVYFRGNGGEFTLYPNGSAPFLPNDGYANVTKAQDGRAKSFQSFCVEMTEYLQNPMEVWVSTTSTISPLDGSGSHAIYGGVFPAGDDLDSRTAYLYTRFAAGALSNYNYGVGRNVSAGTLQKTIWLLENEIGNLWDNAGGFALDATQQAQATAWITEAGNAINNGNWSGIGQVRILNMWGLDQNGQYVKIAQDQLYVPIPAAVLLGMLGLGAAGLKLRKYA